MGSVEDQFDAFEIDEELQQLKQNLHNPSRPPQGEQKYTPQNNDKRKRFYSMLGLAPDASPKEVKQAYRNLVKRCHPDLFFHDSQLRNKAEEVLTRINQIYEELVSENSL
jgi:DnaJ-domain-containing protein 1